MPQRDIVLIAALRGRVGHAYPADSSLADPALETARTPSD
jgi:hypothetical protein